MKIIALRPENFDKIEKRCAEISREWLEETFKVHRVKATDRANVYLMDRHPDCPIEVPDGYSWGLMLPREAIDRFSFNRQTAFSDFAEVYPKGKL